MQSKKLKKELGLLHIFSIASGAMISSGLFLLPGLAHAKAGPAVILSYGIAGLLALTGLLSQAELVSAMPKTGGDYFYVTRSMGSAAGTINGLVTWFSLSLKSAFALVGMAAFTQVIIGLNIHLLAIVLSTFFVLINIVGIKEAGRVQIVLVFGLLLLLMVYVIMGIPAIRVTNYVPFAPLEGENTFDIVLARSKPGVMFSKENGLAHTIFVLIGTHDERNFYLRALAAIAQIAQNDTFSKKWMNATSKEDLRDAVLLGKRTRLES